MEQINLPELFSKITAQNGGRKLSPKKFEAAMRRELEPLGVTMEKKWIRGKDGVMRQENVFVRTKVRRDEDS